MPLMAKLNKTKMTDMGGIVGILFEEGTLLRRHNVPMDRQLNRATYSMSSTQ